MILESINSDNDYIYFTVFSALQRNRSFKVVESEIKRKVKRPISK